MLRVFIYFGFIVLAAVIAGWFGERPGSVTINWLNYRIETSLAAGLVGLALIIIFFIVLFRLWLLFIQGSATVKRHFEERRKSRGILALTRGMVALAAGDSFAAQRFAKQAEVLPNDLQPLTMLLSAHSAQSRGDEQAAKKYFSQMLELPEMEFLGLRGLILQSSKIGGRDPLLLARRAFAINSYAPWIIAALYELESKAGNWREAERAARNAIRHKVGNLDDSNRKLSIALLQQSLMDEKSGDGVRSRQLLSAHELAPDLVPIGVTLARDLFERRRTRRAARVIETTWQLCPHPELVTVYREIFSEDSAKRWQDRVSRLASLAAPENPEVRLVIAEAAYMAGNHTAALQQLDQLLKIYLDHRAVTLMARILESKHGPAGARPWLTKLDSAVTPGWHCSACSSMQSEWSPYCETCQTFDTLRWGYKGVANPGVIDFSKDDIMFDNVFEQEAPDRVITAETLQK